jgi:hypothetical protein
MHWRPRYAVPAANGVPRHDNHRRRHHLDEQANSEEIGPGWEYYLDALVAAMNDNPLPNFDDYWPSLASAYADPRSA